MKVAGLGLASFGGGAVEAAFLVIVTRMALAIADGKDRTGLLAGRTLSMSSAIAVAALMLVLRLAFALASVVWSTDLVVDVSITLRRRLADAFLGASWSTQQAEPAGRLQQLMTGFVDQAVSVARAFSITVASLLNLAALILGAFLVDPIATLVVVASLIVMGAMLAPVRRRIRTRAQAAARAQMAFATSVSELGALGLEMQTYGVKGQFSDRISALVGLEASARRRATLLQGAVPAIYTSMAYGALLAGLGSAALMGVGKLSSLGAVMLVMLRSLSYGQKLQVASGNLMVGLPFLENVDSTLDRFETDKASGGSTRPIGLGPIDVHCVSFEYQPERPALQDVSFTLEPGAIVGVIGPSGAGKSTMVQLLLGVRDPTEGSVRIGGTDLRDIDRSWWSSRVAFVAQDALLFTGTVAENIRFFRDGISDEAVRQAAKQANVLADIDALAHGFDTHLGERGSQLSGGQRQRLSIARALAGRPELLILDEPTSALDGKSESLIRETITDLRGSVTVIIIAHRMSTLEMCDRLMVIEDGRLAAFEQPAVLRSSSEFYREALELSGIT